MKVQIVLKFLIFKSTSRNVKYTEESTPTRMLHSKNQAELLTGTTVTARNTVMCDRAATSLTYKTHKDSPSHPPLNSPVLAVLAPSGS